MKCLAKMLGYVFCPSHHRWLIVLCHPKTSSLHVLLQVALCYHMLGQLQDAAEVYETSMSYSFISVVDETYSISSTLLGFLFE
jgi:hypothetical protein